MAITELPPKVTDAAKEALAKYREDVPGSQNVAIGSRAGNGSRNKGTEPMPESQTVRKFWNNNTGQWEYTTTPEGETFFDPRTTGKPPLSIEEYKELYEANYSRTAGYFYNAKENNYVFKPITEESMSNKFLPFVVEKSTPLHIFKTLLTRSKGMNQVLIASTFNLILNEDIKMLRAKVKAMDEMPLEKIYEELLIKYPKYRVKDEVLMMFQHIVQFLPHGTEDVPLWVEELQQFSSTDVMLFFCAMACGDTPSGEYTDFPYALIMDKHATDTVLNNVQNYVQFSDTGAKIEFDNAIEFRCFLVYHGIFQKLMEPNKDIPVYNASLKFVSS